MTSSTTPTTAGPTTTEPRGPARRLATTSYWMVAVFAVWTVVFVFASGPVAELLGYETGNAGEVPYIEAWLPWLVVTLLWALPLVAGIVLAVLAKVRGAGGYAWGALIVNGGILLFMAGPPLLGRIINL